MRSNVDEKLGNCAEWRAWYTDKSEAGAVLHVSGRCKFPSPGFSVLLEPLPLQGINPHILLLQRRVSSPIGRKRAHEAFVEVHYSSFTSFTYEYTFCQMALTCPSKQKQPDREEWRGRMLKFLSVHKKRPELGQSCSSSHRIITPGADGSRTPARRAFRAKEWLRCANSAAHR